jgi:hypothetical protein
MSVHIHIDSLGEQRFLGNVEAPLRFSWTEYGSVPKAPMVPRSQWQAVIAGNNGLDSAYLPPVADQNGIGMCFPAGTLIRMGDGSQKPIEQVRVLDEVLTAEGNVRRVVRTMVREEKDSLYRLHVWGHRHLKATAEHPILTKRGYVPIAELTSSDMVAMPKFVPATKSIIQTADYLPAARTYVARETKVSKAQIPGKPPSTIVKHFPPDIIHLTPEFGWIVGLFLAEGSTSCGKAVWNLALHEADTLGAKLVRLLKETLGVEANLRTKESNHTTLVRVYGTRWAELFEAWCAHGCQNKRLHPDLTSGPGEFLSSVLDGWTDGDGLGPNQNGGVTVSHSLTVQMFDIANYFGLVPTMETMDVGTYGAVKSRRRRYITRWGKFPDKCDPRREQDDKYLWRRVDGVVREDFSGWVYNLEVEGDHSYVAEAIGVHNCNAAATASAIESTRMVRGLPHVELSAGDLYHRIAVGGRDNGSLLEDGIREAMANGVASTAVVPYLDWTRDHGWVAVEDRKRFQVLEAFLCPTFDHCMSAVLMGFKLISGIRWWDNFTPDSEGWLPARGRGNYGGHAIFGYKGVERNGVFGIAH